MAGPIETGSVSRRTVLKGLAGAAGLAAVPTILAACGTSGTSAAPESAAASAAAPSAAASAAASAAPSVAIGSLTLGSNYSDPVPKGVLASIVDTFQQQTGSTVKVNTVDHGTFQDQISAYLQGTPDDVFTWFSGFRMRFFAAQGLATDISDVWSSVGANFSDAFKVGSTGDDGKQYFIPIYNYPWAVFYRKSVFQDKGYTVPATLDDFKALSQKMKSDGLVPIAFGDKDGWPAMGTFDIINLRTNGYDFHVGLMAGKEKWTDPKVTTVFNTFKDLLPFHQEGAAGRTWQDAAQTLVQKKAGMYLLGMFVSQQFQTAGAADLADLDFFPYPSFGTQYDAEKALDAPIDGFMLSANSPTLAGRHGRCQGVPRVPRAAGDAGRLGQPGPEQHRGQQERRHEQVHPAPVEGRAADRRCPAHHPVPRPRHQPELRRGERHAGLPPRLHQDPRSGPGRLPEEDPGLLGHAVAARARPD